MFGMRKEGVPSAPSGMEQMVAKMLGFTPAEMAETVTGFRDTIVQVRDLLESVKAQQVETLALLKEMRDERRDGSNGDRKPRRGTGRGSGGLAGTSAGGSVRGAFDGDRKGAFGGD